MTDALYIALYHEFGSPTYITRRYSAQGEKIRDYEMIMNYWFPSLPLFPQVDGESGIDEISSDSTLSSGSLYSINGMLVKESVDYGAWSGISPGIYIWRSENTARKVLIK